MPDAVYRSLNKGVMCKSVTLSHSSHRGVVPNIQQLLQVCCVSMNTWNLIKSIKASTSVNNSNKNILTRNTRSKWCYGIKASTSGDPNILMYETSRVNDIFTVLYLQETGMTDLPEMCYVCFFYHMPVILTYPNSKTSELCLQQTTTTINLSDLKKYVVRYHFLADGHRSATEDDI